MPRMNSDAVPPRFHSEGTVIPARPLLLGLAGLVPFWGLAVLLAATPAAGYTTGQVAFALSAYGAVIVSFLGGIRWGLATAAPAARISGEFERAVIPSLLAWAALALSPAFGLLALGLVALALAPADCILVTKGLAPPWYGRLRLILSGGAGVALLVGATVVAVRGG